MEQLPRPGEKRLALHIKPGVEDVIRGGHPWLFEQAIVRQSHEGQPGDLAVIFDRKNRFLAIGLYDPLSPIRVKLLQHNRPATINQDWFHGRLDAAARIRQPLLETQTNGYRLVHGENDGLPGLIIDRYAETIVVKLYTAAWFPHLSTLLPALAQVQPAERIVLRLSRAGQNQAGFGLYDGQILYGEPLHQPLIFQENGLLFLADVVKGHKTGFFFDHRENRALVGQLARGEVLDVFAYSGAFSLYAARGGADTVLSADASAPALQIARENFALNSNDPHVAHARHEIRVGNAFETMHALKTAGRSFDSRSTFFREKHPRNTRRAGVLRALDTISARYAR
jgi:23S rRNA (cytosine1962-C5)-methyltransferase